MPTTAQVRKVLEANADDAPGYASHQKINRGSQRKGHPRLPSTVLYRRNMFEIVKQGKSPADVMWRNMMWWEEKALALTKRVEELLDQSELDEEGRAEAIATQKSMVAARDKMQECAVDLAPYFHPRLATVTLQPEAPETAPEAVPDDPLGASQVYQRLIAGHGGGG